MNMCPMPICLRRSVVLMFKALLSVSARAHSDKCPMVHALRTSLSRMTPHLPSWDLCGALRMAQRFRISRILARNGIVLPKNRINVSNAVGRSFMKVELTGTWLEVSLRLAYPGFLLRISLCLH